MRRVAAKLKDIPEARRKEALAIGVRVGERVELPASFLSESSIDDALSREIARSGHAAPCKGCGR